MECLYKLSFLFLLYSTANGLWLDNSTKNDTEKQGSKKKTLIIVILDESGSMGPKKSDVIGGFNGFLDGQKDVKEDDATFYMVKFNTVTTVVHKGLEMKDVPNLSNNNYNPAGGTALYDAVAEGVGIAQKNKKSDERVVCVIMTDGEENSSRETTKEQVKKLISGKEAEGDWTFVYIGENPERWTKDTGMQIGNAIPYDHRNASANFGAANIAVQNYRQQNLNQVANLFPAGGR